jgi:hypothetical protein
MIRCRISGWLLAAALVASCAPALAEGPPSSVDRLPSRQILVMLKAAPEHFRVGAAYAATTHYGGTGLIEARRRSAEAVARKNGFALVDGWPMPLLGVDCYVMRLPAGVPIDAAVERVSREPGVAWSEPMQLYQAQGEKSARGSDPLLPVEPAAEWRLGELHRFATGRGVSVAIIDSKVEVTHPDLAGHFVADKNFLGTDARTAEQHGTAVAGIIGATAGNGIGIAGIAPGAELMALRACWQVRSGGASPPTLCDSLGIARALQYAIEHKAEVINLSLAGPPGILLAKLISIALARKESVVAAYDPTLPNGGFPASLRGVIAVADQSLQNLPGNVYGAPGRDIPTTEPGGKWYLVNGTSYAVAHVSGLIALVRQRDRGMPLSLARAPSGRVNACASLLGTTHSCDCDCRISQAHRSVAR